MSQSVFSCQDQNTGDEGARRFHLTGPFMRYYMRDYVGCV
jgi:hypothetical protein